MIKKILTILALLIILASQNLLLEQTDCSVELKQASEAHDKGLYQQAIDLLSQTLNKCEFNDADRQQALKILISSYAEMDELEEANRLSYMFLKENPIYTFYTTDPQSFVSQVQRFNVRPKLTIGASFGLSFAKLKTLTTYAVWNPLEKSSSYTTLSGNKTSLDLMYHLSDKLSVIFSSMEVTSKYQRKFSVYDNFSQIFDETIMTGNIGLALQYDYHFGKKWYPSAYCGFYLSRLVSATANIETMDKYYDSQNKISDLDDIKTGINLFKYRNPYNYGLITGFGINYKVKKLIFTGSLSYFWDMDQITNTNYHYNSEPLLVDYYYAGNDFKLRNLNFTFGIAYNLLYSIKSKY